MRSGASTLFVAFALGSFVNCSSSAHEHSTSTAGQTSSSAGRSSASAGSSAAGAAQSAGSGGSTTGTTAAVSGPGDAHCTGRPLGISDPAICTSTAGASSFAGANGMTTNGGTSGGGTGGTDNADSGGASAGTGGVNCNESHDAGYGENLYGSEGDDDDCKYHVSWTSTPVQKGKPFMLTVTATSKATGKPLEHIAAQDPGKPALSRIEPFLPCEPSHLAPTSDYEAAVTEVGPGTFTVGPVVFDESGRWVVRYHFYEECFNNVTTPHAHIAFFVNVP